MAWPLETFPWLTLVPVGFWCLNLLSRASPFASPLPSCLPASRTVALYGDGMNARPQANSGAFPVYLYSFCKSSFFLRVLESTLTILFSPSRFVRDCDVVIVPSSWDVTHNCARRPSCSLSRPSSYSRHPSRHPSLSRRPSLSPSPPTHASHPLSYQVPTFCSGMGLIAVPSPLFSVWDVTRHNVAVLSCDLGEG